jgi:osmotically-inducible protein OsmY
LRPRTDAQIRDDVAAALRDAAGVDALAIEVSARDGAIELKGEMASHSERLQAMTVAKSVAAPARVRSKLTVKASGRDFRLTDGDVAVEVTRALVQSDVPPGAITFDVHNRVVTLHGEAADSQERARIRHIVQAARGVDFIENQIVIRDSASADHREQGLP